MWTLIKTGISTLVPGAGLALKLAPWAIAGVLALAIYVEHERLVAADANITASKAQVAQEISVCQAEASQTAAAQDAATTEAVQQAQAQANAAEAQLQDEFKASAATTTASDATITEEAAQPGQDAPVAPVLADLNKALEAGQ